MPQSRANETSELPKEDLLGYEVVVGITGGIAVYKVCSVVSALVQRGAGVTCVMTESATRFVTPLTFQALSGRQTITSLWGHEMAYDPQHVKLSDQADLCLVAPATANIIGKIACGIADDVLSTLMLAFTCPVILAPAMNCNMWTNPAVQANVAKLREQGHRMIGPREGWLACKTIGVGRMEEADVLVEAVAETLKTDPPKGGAS